MEIMKVVFQQPTSLMGWVADAKTPSAKAQSYFVASKIMWLFRSDSSYSREREAVVGTFESVAWKLHGKWETHSSTYPVYKFFIPEVGELYFMYQHGSWIITCDFEVPVQADFKNLISLGPDYEVTEEYGEGLMPMYGSLAANRRRFTVQVQQLKEDDYFKFYAFMYTLSQAIGGPRR